jgi:quinoprotein glucose dehydrogenase
MIKFKYKFLLTVFFIIIILFSSHILIKKFFFLSGFERKLQNLVKNSKYENLARKFYYNLKYGMKSVNNGGVFYLSEDYLRMDIYDENFKRKKIKGINNNIKKYLIEYKLETEKWFRSHGGNKNQKFSSSDIINHENIKGLKLAWEFEHENDKFKTVEANPIFYKNSIISVTSNYGLVSLNAINGEINWNISFQEKNIARRGFVLDIEKNGSAFLYVLADRKLYKINAQNGEFDLSFNRKGYIENFFSLTAPFINEDKLYITNMTPPSLVVYNKISGKKILTIDLNPKNKNFTGGSPWMGTAFDEKNKIAFISTGNPRPPLDGLTRPGRNENSNSIIAIDLKKKKILWTFQEIAHDLWDFDIGCPPLLTEISYEKKFLEVVVCVTKVGNTLIFERKSGKPLFDVNFANIPTSKMQNQETWQQIKSDLPENVASVEYSNKSFDALNEEKQSYINEIFKNSDTGWFIPPNYGQKNIFFGVHGGSNWYGSANNPYTHQIFTPINHIPYESMLYGVDISKSQPDELKHYGLYLENCASCHGKNRNIKLDKNLEKINRYVPSLVGLTLFKDAKKKISHYKNFKKKHKIDITNDTFEKINQLFVEWDNKLLKNESIKLDFYWASFLDKKDNNFLSNPPWGEVVSMDLKSGKVLWKTPIGIDKKTDKDRIIGTSIYGGCSVNRNNILFCVGTDDGFIYAINGYNGEIIWKYQMDFAGTAAPLIYKVNNSEYVTVVASGSNIVSKDFVAGNKIITFVLSK